MNSPWVAWFSACRLSMSLPQEGGGGVVGMRRFPVPRDVDAARDPHAIVRGHVVEETLQGTQAPGPPEQPAVHAHAHHRGALVALGIQHVEAVAQVLEELVAVR